MITEDYVSFKTAKLLSDKGFNNPTLAYAYSDDMIGYYSKPRITDILSIEVGRIPMPTLQMVMKWLREVHNLFIQITVDFSDGAYPMYDVGVVNLAICTSITVNRYDRYSYKEAVEAAIKYCLEHLI